MPERAIACAELQDPVTSLAVAAEGFPQPSMISHDGIDPAQFATAAHCLWGGAGQGIEQFGLDEAGHLADRETSLP